MLDTIGNIKNKSDHTKKKILVITVTIIMALIITIWLSLPADTSVSREQKEDANTTAGPLELLWEKLKEPTSTGNE